MTSPNNAYVGGALDLSQVKARAEARQKAQESPQTTAGGIQPFFTVTEANFDQDVVRRSTEVPVIVLIGTADTHKAIGRIGGHVLPLSVALALLYNEVSRSPKSA